MAAITLKTYDKLEIIQRHPCFTHLMPEEAEKLAELLAEKRFATGQVIVNEDDIVDSVYFIAEGTAEVRQSVLDSEVDKQEIMPVAILNPGEAIGLSDSGLYSTSGRRTATVVAQTDMVLFRLDIAAFYKFLEKHNHANTVLRDNVHLLLRMRLIKQAAPFAALTMQHIYWLAQQVTDKDFPAGEIIFAKGDPGDNCYLIQSGKIEIFITNPDQTESRVAVLKSPLIFGEAALLTDLPRNASARAINDCNLLVLSRDALLEVVKTETNTAKSLLTLLKSRSRPMRLPYIECHQYENKKKEMITTLKDSKNVNYYRLTEEGLFIWELLDGKHTIRDISLAFYNEYDVFDPGMVSTFVMDLHESGFVETDLHEEETKQQQSLWRSAVLAMRNILEASYNFGNADDWITKTYQHGVYLLFTIPARLIYLMVIVAGLSLFFIESPRHVFLLRHLHHAGGIIFAAIIFMMFMTIFHELAHAYTTKYFGRSVKNFGIGWFWIGPVAFCDTSDMWLSPRWARVRVDLAGLTFDLFLASVVSIAAFYTTNNFLTLFFWIVATLKLLNIFANLSPIIELDGYYALMDVFDKEDLREEAIHWLAWDFPKTWSSPRLIWRDHKVEFLYWAICIVYLILNIIIPYIVLNVLLYGLFGVHNPYLTIIFTVIILIMSGLAIRAELKQRR